MARMHFLFYFLKKQTSRNFGLHEVYLRVKSRYRGSPLGFLACAFFAGVIKPSFSINYWLWAPQAEIFLGVFSSVFVCDFGVFLHVFHAIFLPWTPTAYLLCTSVFCFWLASIAVGVACCWCFCDFCLMPVCVPAFCT